MSNHVVVSLSALLSGMAIGGAVTITAVDAAKRDDVIVCVIRPEYGPMEDNKLTVNVFCEEYR